MATRRAFDIFWRDQKLQSRISTTGSRIATWTPSGLFQQFQQAATPTFVSKHNASLIAKKWFEKITTSANFTYSYTSGRPYYNPNRNDESEFLADRTPPVHNLSFAASKIMTIKGQLRRTLYLTVDNLLNTRNVFTYRYTPDGETRYAVGPQSYRSFFIGVQIMLSKKAVVGREDV